VANGDVVDLTLPDLRGLGAREAIRELARLGLSPRTEGTGVVVGQRPSAGSPVDPGTVCTLVLDRNPPPAIVAGVPPL
ncbi:MAG: PASTA domain-containing protein, partial [Acidobacteriota bacterium]|nr:PASTA domain-containing protein [Acidobacteriota bacterium]